MMIELSPNLKTKKIHDLSVSEFCQVFETCLLYYFAQKEAISTDVPSIVSIRDISHEHKFDSYAAKRTTIFWLAMYAADNQSYIIQSKPSSSSIRSLLQTKIDLANISKAKLKALHCRQNTKDIIEKIVVKKGYKLLD